MTIQEQYVEVYRQFQEAQRKYVYFLLAVAGAGISISVKYTMGHCISVSQVPLAIAVVLWGTSFFCGCKFLGIQASLLYTNALLLSFKSKLVPKNQQDLLRLSELDKSFDESFERRSALGEKWGRTQLFLIFYGALFFIEWHLLELVNNSMGQ